MERRVRVRFAPSPTGPLHMGGVRTALYNYLFAKKHGGDFLLRVEDTDQTRLIQGAEEYIQESLKWCGIVPDEGQGYGGNVGPYKQSERKEQGIYKKYADQLVAEDKAYYAFDTPEELDQMREDLKKAGVAAPQYNAITRMRMKNSISLSAEEVQKRIDNGDPYVIRIKIPRNEEIKFQDLIRGWVSVHTSNLDDKVLFKSDGMPTYHLANIVDDHLMNISHVIRGEEWLPSAPLHIYLYEAFGWSDSRPDFAHLPLLLKPDPTSYVNKKNKEHFAEVFEQDFIKKMAKEGVTHDEAKVRKVMMQVFQNPKEIQQQLRERDNDSNVHSDVKSFLKGAMYGKLSKRDGDRLGFPVFPLEWKDPSSGEISSGYREKGYFNDAFVNILAFLGWNPGTSQEIFSLQELINTFSLDRVGKAGAKYDPDKARWFNQQYLRSRSGVSLAEELQLHHSSLEEIKSADKEFLAGICDLMKERATFLADIPQEGAYFFSPPKEYDANTVQKKWKEDSAALMQEWQEELGKISDYTAEVIETTFKSFLEQKELGIGAILPLFRLLVTGKGMGPSMFSIAALLGQEETITRITEGIPKLS